MKIPIQSKAFTLLELLVVIAIIVVLASLLMAGVFMAIERSRRTQCMNHLMQFGKGVMHYRLDNDDDYPPYLSVLFGAGYFDGGAGIYVCPVDPTKGADGGIPSVWGNQYADNDDTSTNTSSTAGLRNPGITHCSYIYELTQNTIPDPSDPANAWVVNPRDTGQDLSSFTWEDFKKLQADILGVSSVPMVRCFWHGFKKTQGDEEAILNVAMDTSFFFCSAGGANSWESKAGAPDWPTIPAYMLNP